MNERQESDEGGPEDLLHHAKLFQALSDPSRLQIFLILADASDPLCVQDVHQRVQNHQRSLAMKNVSLHLKILSEVQLINRQRIGKKVLCSISAFGVRMYGLLNSLET